VIGIACLLHSLGYKCKICFDRVIGIACLLPSLEYKCETCFDSVIGIAYLLPFFGCKCETCFNSVIGIAYLLPFFGCKCETCLDSMIGMSLVLSDSCVSLIVWQDCVFSIVFFCFVCFVNLMDMSKMEEHQVVHDATQVVGNNRALPTMMGLHDVLRNIEQMLAPFKRYIEASEAGMAQAPPVAQALPVAQAPSMVQAPLVAQENVPANNAWEPKFIIPEKFDGTRSKFRGFVQQVNLFLCLHPSRYLDDSTQVTFIGSLLSGNALSWFAPF
jgi:hypothetical protein